ncbi:hypothetical protein HPP92_010594 [Vanilla planifolia]|uniref:FLZ-type domain-containing protein n=1 Tax=Vanilla planifolia TaxID=51239 RepID=A0A835QZC2_VANPL|nr:hypothetical protein HPP92_010594 [Vanilla planifolia]
MLSRGNRFAEIPMENSSRCVATNSVFSPESFTGDSAARSSVFRSPLSFGGGAIGLGIVAAMSEGVAHRPKPATEDTPSARSMPIPIVPRHLPEAAKRRVRESAEEHEMDEEDECYTCVLSSVGGNSTRKRLFLNAGFDVAVAGAFGIFSVSPTPVTETYFLSCCYLCRKKLHGLDIFMYRGDKAFCSSECRFQQILTDERKEKKWSTKAAKPLKLSPSPLLLSTSVVAA